MKKRIAIIIISMIVILIVITAIIIILINKNKENRIIIRSSLGNYKFIITEIDASAVDGPRTVYYIYDDKIIYRSFVNTPDDTYIETITYYDVDTSNIEYKEDETTNAIIRGNSEALQEIEEAIEGKEGERTVEEAVEIDSSDFREQIAY